MALENCVDLLLKMNDAIKNRIDIMTALYFVQKFKPHLNLLEK